MEQAADKMSRVIFSQLSHQRSMSEHYPAWQKPFPYILPHWQDLGIYCKCNELQIIERELITLLITKLHLRGT